MDSALVDVDDSQDYGEDRYNAIGWLDANLHYLTFTSPAAFAEQSVCAEPLSQSSDPMPKKLSKYGVPDADTPEWTPERFARAKRMSEMPEDFQRAFRRKGRGPQKAPVKEQVTMRLSPDVMEAVRKTGPRWQVRVNEVLRKEFVGKQGIVGRG